MKGRHFLSASGLALCLFFVYGPVSGETSPSNDCVALDLNDSSEGALAQRLSCYNNELDSLSLLIGNLLKEREQLSSLLDGTEATEIAEDNSAEQQSTIERLRQERSELSAQLHRQLIENQEKLLDKEAEERLLRNYSQAYLAIADENAALVARIKTLNQRITELDRAKATLTDNNAQYEQNSKTYRSTIADLSAKRTQLTQDLNDRESLITKLRAQLIEGAALGERLSADMNLLQQDLLSTQHSKNIAESNIAHLNTAIANFASSKKNQQQLYVTQIEELQSRLSQQTTDYEILTDAAEKSSEEYRKQLETHVSEIEALGVELADLQKTRSALKAQLEAADQLLAEQNDSIAKLNRTNQEQQQNIASVNTSIASFRNQLGDAELELQTVRSEVAARNTELSGTRQELKKMKLAIDAREKELTSLKGATTEFQSQVAALEAQLADSNGKIEQLQDSLNTTISELEKVSQSRATTLAASNSLLDTNTTLRKNLSAANFDLKQAEADSALLRSEFATLQNEKDASTTEIKGLQQTIASLRALLDQSQSNNEQFADSLDKIKLELSASNGRLADQQSQLQSLVREKESIVEALNKSQTETERLAQEITGNLGELGQSESVTVDVLPDNTIGLKIASNQLFRVGSSRLSAEGQQLLAKVAAALTGTSKRRILIEGHSDNLPLGPKLARVFKDNMGLSMARALSAANFLAEDTPLPEQQLSISGAGDTRPVVPNDTAGGRQQNRRVEILLLPLAYSNSAR